MTDPIVTIYSRIVQLLQAEPTLYDPTAKNRDLIVPKNFISYAGTNPHPEKKGYQDFDFPELDVDEAGYTDTGFTKWQTFGNCANREEIVQVYQITLTGRDYRLEPLSKLRFAVSIALSKGGPRFGLPSNLVRQWGPINGSPSAKVLVKDALGTEGGTNRRQLKLTFPVSILVNASDLQN